MGGAMMWSASWYASLTVEEVDQLYELGLLDMGEVDVLLGEIAKRSE